MVINKDGLITENQNTQDTTLLNKQEQNTLNEDFKNFDLNSNIDNEMSKEIEYNKKLDECLKNFVTQDNTENKANPNSSEFSEENLNSNISDLSSEKGENDESKEKTVETNCLALTVRKDYNFSIAKNTVFKTIRMSIKVAISTLVLNLIKIFF